MLPDGQLLLMGRMDRQHKVRGVRVDLEEVESVLARAPGVRQAVVVPSPPGLVAYLVRERGADPQPRLVAAHAAKWLPRAVCPVRYGTLDRPPLTPNGKIDHTALAQVATAVVAGSPITREPTETEHAVAELCAQAIDGGRPTTVDPTADFFELGGHSLLLARWIGLVRDRFAVDLPIREVLREPTVARVAALVEAGAPRVRRPPPRVRRARVRWTPRPQRGGDSA
jgi:acyl carrier protein